MAERSKAAVLKTVVSQDTGGSNPSRSVFDNTGRCGRAVIQRIANPSVPLRAGQVRLLSPPVLTDCTYPVVLFKRKHEIVAQPD